MLRREAGKGGQDTERERAAGFPGHRALRKREVRQNSPSLFPKLEATLPQSSPPMPEQARRGRDLYLHHIKKLSNLRAKKRNNPIVLNGQKI